MPRRAGVLASLAGLLGVVALTLLSSAPATPPASPGTSASHEEPLPSPRLTGGLALDTVLATRRSVRSFAAQPLTAAEIGQLLWAAQGVTDSAGHRTAPSAGATYPLELDIVTADGLARYLPATHSLAWRGSADLRPALRQAALDQAAVGDAPVVIVIVGVEARTAARYGERAARYMTLEAGHAAQNILLEAVNLGLGAVPIGAFDDEAVRRVLALDDGETPLYLVPAGHTPEAGFP